MYSEFYNLVCLSENLLSVPGSPSIKHSLDKCNDYFATVGKNLALLNKDQKSHASTTSSDKWPINYFFIQPTMLVRLNL